jgi:hypothetical protein
VNAIGVEDVPVGRIMDPPTIPLQLIPLPTLLVLTMVLLLAPLLILLLVSPLARPLPPTEALEALALHPLVVAHLLMKMVSN